MPPLARDTTLHVIGFTGLGILTIWRVGAKYRVVPISAVVTWYVALLLYAAFDELTQPLTGRSCEWIDWVADAGGAAIGASLAFLWYRCREGSTCRK
jgi:VanZ family protein